ncbi:hypothetical protein Tco_0843923 [Tanacetum coccineum]
MPASNEALRELCDKNYHQLLPLIAEKMQKEKEQQDKLKAVKARLTSAMNLEEIQETMKSPTTPNPKRQLPGQSREEGMGTSTPEARHQSPVSSEDSNKTDLLHSAVAVGWEGGVFNRLGRKEPGAYTRSDSHYQSSQAKGTEVPARKHHHEGTSSQRTSGYSESEDSEGGHWKSKSKRHRFDFPRDYDASHVKTYDGSGDPEDHIKLFQSAAKTERWTMPTWCHMFNSDANWGIARCRFDNSPKRSIDTLMKICTEAAFREKLSPVNKSQFGSSRDTSHQAKGRRIHEGFHGEIQRRSPGRGRSAGMHEDLRIHAWDNPP